MFSREPSCHVEVFYIFSNEEILTESELVQWISSVSETMAFAEVILLNPAAWLP